MIIYNNMDIYSYLHLVPPSSISQLILLSEYGHSRQSRLDIGLDFQVIVLYTFQVVPVSLVPHPPTTTMSILSVKPEPLIPEL
jgi:hypothetical protein